MKKNKLPQSDSIEELARFLQANDLTDFDDELVEVTEPVFSQRKSLRVRLEDREAKAVRKLAKAQGVSQEELLRSWVLEHLSPRNGPAKGKRTLIRTRK